MKNRIILAKFNRRESKEIEYGRRPNGSLGVLVPGALPLAMLKKAVGHGLRSQPGCGKGFVARQLLFGRSYHVMCRFGVIARTN